MGKWCEGVRLEGGRFSFTFSSEASNFQYYCSLLNICLALFAGSWHVPTIVQGAKTNCAYAKWCGCCKMYMYMQTFTSSTIYKPQFVRTIFSQTICLAVFLQLSIYWPTLSLEISPLTFSHFALTFPRPISLSSFRFCLFLPPNLGGIYGFLFLDGEIYEFRTDKSRSFISSNKFRLLLLSPRTIQLSISFRIFPHFRWGLLLLLICSKKF